MFGLKCREARCGDKIKIKNIFMPIKNKGKNEYKYKI